MNPASEDRSGSAVFDEVAKDMSRLLGRTDLNRHDATTLITEAIARSGLAVTATDFFSGRLEPEAVRSILSVAAMPPPVAPLAMPVQDLTRRSRYRRLAGITQRRTTA